MKTWGIGDPLARAAVRAVQQGGVDVLHQLLTAQPGPATARIGKRSPGGMSGTLLHVATDWPGHFPRGAASVAVLAQGGADVNARFRGPCGETPLHWAASSGDVAVLDALLDAGAGIDAPGAVIAGGTPRDDATAFAQWNSHRGRRRGVWSPAAHVSTSSLRHRSGSWTSSDQIGSDPPNSATGSGPPATAGRSPQHSTCSATVPCLTGSPPGNH